MRSRSNASTSLGKDDPKASVADDGDGDVGDDSPREGDGETAGAARNGGADDGIADTGGATSASRDGMVEIPWGSQTPDGQVFLGLPWEIFVLGVAVLSIINLFLALVIRNPDLDQIVSVTDGIYILIFAADFARRWRVASDPRSYVTKGM